MHKPLNTLLAATLATLTLVPAARAADPAADTVVATVNGQEITLGHMIVLTTQLPQEYQSLPDEVLYEAVLDQLIKQSAVAQTIDGKLTKSARIALENERRSFLAGEALAARAEGAITDEAVAAAYAERYAGAEPEVEFHASHILVETEEKAAALKDELDGGADFAALAREHSTGPSGRQGGDLGWFTDDMMVPEFQQAVETLSPGEVSDPVQTDFGWHLVLLQETREKAAPGLEEVRDDIASELQQAAVSAALEEITAAAEITQSETEIDPAVLRNMELLED